MDVLEWLFSRKENEIELKPITQLKRTLKIPLKVFNDFFNSLNEKRELLSKVQFNPGKPKEYGYFFNSSKIRNKIKNLNTVLIKSLAKVLDMEKFDENLLKHLLVESSTRLHHVSEELRIKAINPKSYKVNNLEEAKRRSYWILKEEESIKKLMNETSDQFDNIRVWLNKYPPFLKEQTGSIESDRTEKYMQSISEELNFLDRLIVKFKRFILSVITKSRKIVDVRDIELRKQTLLSIGGGTKEAILIFHSYANSPEENEEMAGYFASQGFSVFAPRMPGHGTKEDEFYNTSMEEICYFGQQCLDYFYGKNGNKPVFITGLSLGGMVTLYLATKKDNLGKIKGIIPINAYIKAPIQAKFLDWIPFGTRSFEFLLRKSGLRFLKKSSINMVKRKAKHIAKSINPINFHNFDSSFEDGLVNEFLQRIDEEFKDNLEEQIKGRQGEEKKIRQGYEAMKDRLEQNFRQRYRNRKISAFDIKDITRLLEFEFYNVMTYKGMVQLSRLSGILQKTMKDIKAPVLIIQSEGDKTVDPKSAKIIYRCCSNADYRELKFIPDAGHILILERQRYDVFESINKFIEKIVIGQKAPLT
ncbi:alpha/beta fold hydrolase [Candidatus Woesearchaeota archaeon]|nr:alpha/beta fold hydrolase [Candidatus Woesearchaeota archaeon]